MAPHAADVMGTQRKPQKAKGAGRKIIALSINFLLVSKQKKNLAGCTSGERVQRTQTRRRDTECTCSHSAGVEKGKQGKEIFLKT